MLRRVGDYSVKLEWQLCNENYKCCEIVLEPNQAPFARVNTNSDFQDYHPMLI